MTKKIASMPIYPLLFSLYVPLAFYIKNANEAYLSQLAVPIAISLLVILISFGCCGLVFRNLGKTALMTFILTAVFFFHGHVRNIIGEINIVFDTFTIGEDKILFLFWGILLTISFLIILRSKKDLTLLTKTINVFALTALSISVFLFLQLLTRGSVMVSRQEYENKLLPQPAADGDFSGELPDIYHIILDKYASNKVLKDLYNYDNSAYTDYLENKGFFVAYNSRANYPHTLYSLATTLNMEYVETLAENLGTNSEETHGELGIVLPSFHNHAVGQILTERGYAYYHIGSWFQATQISRFATENIFFDNTKLPNLGGAEIQLDEFTEDFLETTLLEPIARRFLVLDFVDQHLASIKFAFNKLETLIKTKESPKFVFAHILFPHAPYVLNSNCEELKLGAAADADPYLGSIECANKKIQSIVDSILSLDKHSIIIIQSDEGPNATRQEMPDNDYHFVNASDDTVRKRTEIQYAVYLPDSDYSAFYQEISPVNTYRIILSKLFGLDYPLLKDVTYITDTMDDLYEFNFRVAAP